MKRLLLLFLTIFLASSMYSQRMLEWSIGDVQITCGEVTEICYPVMVSINDDSQIPQLSTSTIRFFYDAGYLSNLSIENIENSYSLSGFSESADVYGGVFNFTGGGGVFSQFDLLVNNNNPIALSTAPVHVLDLCFTVDAGASFPLCAPIVFDNNHCGWDAGIGSDDGYLVNDAGMVGTYYLDGNTADAILADDEVINFLWEENPGFDCRVDALSDNVGATAGTACIEDVCNADIALVKTGNYSAGTGEITYTYEVTNVGPATLYDVVVSESTFTGTGALPVPGSENITTNGGTSGDAAVDGVIDVLAPGDVAVFTATYQLTQADIDEGGISNQAIVTGNPATGPPVSDVSDDNSTLEDDPTFTLITQEPSIALIKTASVSGTGQLGDVITYTFTVTNTGNVTLSGTAIDDALTASSGLAVSPAVLAPGEVGTATAIYTIQQSDIDNGFVENQATVTGTYTDAEGIPQTTSDQSDDDSNLEDEPTVVPTLQSPSIAMIKTASVDGTGQLGDLVTYTFTVTNTGNVTLNNVQVDDALTASAGLLVTPSTLAPGEVGTASATYTVQQSDIDNGFVENQAGVTGAFTDIDGVPQTTSDLSDDDSNLEDEPTVVPTAQSPSIALIKTASVGGSGQLGDVITYTFTVTNTGNVTLNGVSIDDALTGSVDLPVTPSTLAPGEVGTATATYTIQQSDIDNGLVENQATVTGNYTDAGGIPQTTSDQSDDDSNEEDQPTITPVVQSPSIALIKTASVGGNGLIGDVITYTFTVTNTGNVTLNGVVVDDALTGSADLAVTPSTLAPGEVGTATASYTIQQSDIDNGFVENQATVTGSYTDGDNTPLSTTDQSDDDSNLEDEPTVTPVTQAPSIALIKTASVSGNGLVGDVITYTFTVTNTGNVTLSGVVIDDALTGSAALAVTPSTLAPGETATATATYTIQQADVNNGFVENQATATGNYTDAAGVPQTTTDQSDDDSNLEDEPTVVITSQDPSLALIKTASVGGTGTGAVGEVITYTFTVTNTGNVMLNNIAIDDALTGSVALAITPSTLAPGETGTATATYTILLSDVENGFVENQATASGIYTDAGGTPQSTSDLSDDNSNEEDDPTVVLLCPAVDNLISSDPTDCGGVDGSITIEAIGADLIYSIDGGVIFSDNNEFLGLGAGSYEVIVRSLSSDCEVAYGTVLLTVPQSPLFTNVFVTNVSDCGASDGGIVIAAEGGNSGTFEFSIDGGATWQGSNGFPNLPAGFYPIAIRNADGSCPVSGPTVQLVPPPAPVLDFVAVTNPSGCGVDNGVITVYASGGDAALALQYSIDGGVSWTINNTFSGLAEGTYSVQVRNGNGTCESGPAIAELTAKTKPVITGVTSTDPDCGATGTIIVTADGGEVAGSYRISIDGGINFQNTNNGTKTFTGLAPGNYTILVQNLDGSCEVTWEENIVLQPICADLSLTKQIDVAQASVGDQVVFTITLNNNGPSDAGGIEVADQLPAGYVFVSANPSQGNYDAITGIWQLGDLANQASATLEMIATVTGVNDYQNIAQITAADQDDPNSDPAIGFGVDDLGDGLPDNDEDSASVSLCIDFELWIYLEGSLITPQTGQYQTPMRTTLNDSRLLPGQYSENPFTGNIYTPVLGASGQVYRINPWAYSGTEGDSFDSGGLSAAAAASYPATVTDWILVSLRSDPENGAEILCQRAALLHSDGSIAFVSDADCCDLDPSQSYYIVIEHRNHLIVMSHTAVPVIEGKITYDFRDKQSYVNDPLSSNSYIGQKEVLPGVFAMFAGNGDQTSVDNEDTDITASDYAKWLNNGPETRNFKLIDYNMDGDISALDFDLWQSNSPRFTSVKRD